MSEKQICSTCSVEIGTFVIHDPAKFVASPTPCPECMARWEEYAERRGCEMAEKRDAEVLKDLLYGEIRLRRQGDD